MRAHEGRIMDDYTFQVNCKISFLPSSSAVTHWAVGTTHGPNSLPSGLQGPFWGILWAGG